MKLKDLCVDLVILDAVDFSTFLVEGLEANCIKFRLDGKVYVVSENPQDGYRSHAEELKRLDRGSIRNVFKGVAVGAYHISKRQAGLSGFETMDVLELRGIRSKKTILEIGTVNCDDYYPYFLGNFYPEALTEEMALTYNSKNDLLQKAAS